VIPPLDKKNLDISFGILYVVFPMDIHFQSLMSLQHKLEASNTKFQRNMEAIEESIITTHERYFRNLMYIDITRELKKYMLGMIMRKIVRICI
jgi:hypothetical protein